MTLCGHEGMPRGRERPAPATACLCTFCDLALFKGWLARVKAIPTAKGVKWQAKAREQREAVLAEVWDSLIGRDAMGIGITLCEVATALYINDYDAAATPLEALVEDEELMQAHLDPTERFRGCPSKPLAPTPLFDGGAA